MEIKYWTDINIEMNTFTAGNIQFAIQRYYVLQK